MLEGLAARENTMLPRIGHALMPALVAAFCVQSGVALRAQVSTSQEAQRAVLDGLRTSIIRSIGAQAPTVEIAVSDKVFTVLRVNSNMNRSTHAGRDNEAAAIATIVSEAIVGKHEFDSLVTLRVDYLDRSTSGESKVIDSVEFREDSAGRFRFHRT